MFQSRITTIARYAVLEAVRTRFALLTLTLVIVLLALSFFVREIAIAETARYQTTLYAAAMRLAAVFVIALHVITSIGREFQDKGLDVALALDLPRSHYIVGKLAGFIAVGAVLALAAGLPLVALAGWEGALQWALSLAFELAIVAALALFCVVTFSNVIPAASFVIGFYLLARSLTAMRLISANPVAGAEDLSHRVMAWLIEALALIIPALDAWTRTAWLTDELAPWPALATIGAHGLVLIALLGAASVFDMHRRAI
jgi:ABC-type transport system involved in multi-copper enzyme maturation permease subunit